MKKARLILLTAVVMIALVVAVVPAFANHVFDQIQSFERDLDGDGEPDFWKLVGDVHWYCHDSMMYDGYCGVIFNEAHYPAAAYVGQNASGIYTNEEGVPDAFGAYVVAQGLDENRAYMGFAYQCIDGSTPKIYGKVPGGTYKGWISVPGIISGFDTPECYLQNIRAGILVMPGYGRILFDAVDMNLPGF